MPVFGNGKGKGKGFNLDCVLGNFEVTILTCCGYVFQGTIEDDNYARTQYGYVCFPPIALEDKKDDCKEDDKKEDKKEDKKPCPQQPIEVDVDVKCDNEPKYICLRLSCVPGFACCDATSSDDPATIRGIFGTNAATGAPLPLLFAVDDTVLINVDDIVVIGPSRTCLPLATPPVA